MNAPFLPLLAIFASAISVQFGAALAKQLFSVAGAVNLAALRLGFAAVILLAVWRPWRMQLTFARLKAVGLLGVCIGFMNLTFYLAIERIPLGLTVALEFIGPLVLAIVSSRRTIDFLWALLAALGIALISPISSSSNLDPMGVFYALVAAVFWAFYIVCGHRVTRVMPAGAGASLGMIFAALAILPVVFLTNNENEITLSILPSAFLVAVCSSAIPYSLEMFALRRLSKRSFGILLSLGPVAAALMGLVMLHEKLDQFQWAAIVCIVMASLGTTLKRPIFASIDQKPVSEDLSGHG